MPSAPAVDLLQHGGLEAVVELRLCDETLALLLDRAGGGAEPSVLVVDLAGTGRAAAVWLAGALEMVAERGGAVTLALPATRQAGRGRLLARHLEDASRRTGVETTVLCGPASVERSAPAGDEIAVVRQAFDVILVLCLGGAAGLGAPWPDHPARRWLELADGAVLGFVDPDSLVGDLERYLVAEPGPLRLRVEALDGPEPDLVGLVDLDDPGRSRRELPLLIETARRHPWRVVVQPRPDLPAPATLLSCPSELGARPLVSPLGLRRSLVVGRLRLVVGEASAAGGALS